MLQAEFDAVREGIAAFASHKKRFEQSSPLLRRNVHRIEKGLCMPVPKPVFAKDFIQETVDLYIRLATRPGGRNSELRWTRDVLNRYFAQVDRSVPEIADAYKAFEGTESTLSFESQEYAPYKVEDLDRISGADQVQPVDFEAFLSLCRQRRSQRWFLDKPVDETILKNAARAALQAPSACNRQPFTFHAAMQREQISRIAALPLGTAGFGEDLPALVAVIGDLSMYSEARDRHLIFIDASLAAMQFMLALTAQGMGSVPINWPDLPENHEKLRGILGLAAHQVPVMLIGVGHPELGSKIPYSAKRDVEEVLHVQH